MALIVRPALDCCNDSSCETVTNYVEGKDDFDACTELNSCVSEAEGDGGCIPTSDSTAYTNWVCADESCG